MSSSLMKASTAPKRTYKYQQQNKIDKAAKYLIMDRSFASETMAITASTLKTTDFTLTKVQENNVTSSMGNESSEDVDIMMVLSIAIASVGIISNLVVVVVFLNHQKLRRKIPNMFIINQVSEIQIYSSVFINII